MSNEVIAAGDVVPASPEESTPIVASQPGPEAERARDDAGRFQKLESSEQLEQQLDIETIKERFWQDQAVKMGLAVPTEDMSSEEWRRAREAQIASGVRDAPTVSPAAAENERRTDGNADQFEARDREILDGYHQRRASFEAGHPDFVEVVNRVQLPENISGPVQVAILENERGPEIAYYLGEHSEIRDRLSQLSVAGAVVEIGRIAERLAQSSQNFDASAREHLGVEIPPAVVSEYQRKAVEVQKHAGLTQEEIGIAQAVGVAPHVSRTIIAMGRPDIALHLVRNVGLVGKLNMMHPMAAAGEIAHIAHELDSEAVADNTRPGATNPAPAPIKPVRKSSPASTGLNDDLPIDEWVKRRNAQVKGKR